MDKISLEGKVAGIAALMGCEFVRHASRATRRALMIESMRRRYRVVCVTPGQVPFPVFITSFIGAGELWSRLDFAEIALRTKWRD